MSRRSEEDHQHLATLFEGPAGPLIFDEIQVQLQQQELEAEISKNKNNRSWGGWFDRKRHNRRHSRIRTLVSIFCASLAPFPIGKTPPSAELTELPLEESSAKYILKQYMASVGGSKIHASFKNAYATGRIKVADLLDGGGVGGGAYGGHFVLWAMMPEKWLIELQAAGVSVRSGCDGLRSWRQSPRGTETFSGAPRPLRRLLYGMCPRAVESIFSVARVTGSANVAGAKCDVLRHVGDSYNGNDVIRHVTYGFFDQKTSLLVMVKDTLTIIPGSSPLGADATACWTVNTESTLQDYRAVGCGPGVVVLPHHGKCTTSISASGDSLLSRPETRFEESWWLDDFDYNVAGLESDFFIAPNDGITICDTDDISLCSPPRRRQKREHDQDPLLALWE